MKISCTFRNRLVSADFDEGERGQVIWGHTPERCGGSVSGIPGETSCDPLFLGQTLGYEVSPEHRSREKEIIGDYSAFLALSARGCMGEGYRVAGREEDLVE